MRNDHENRLQALEDFSRSSRLSELATILARGYIRYRLTQLQTASNQQPTIPSHVKMAEVSEDSDRNPG